MFVVLSVQMCKTLEVSVDRLGFGRGLVVFNAELLGANAAKG